MCEGVGRGGGVLKSKSDTEDNDTGTPKKEMGGGGREGGG